MGHDEVATLADRARRRFGDSIDMLLSTMAAAARIDDIALRRADVTDVDHRFFLALLMNLPNRVEIYDLVSQRFQAEASYMVRRWLRELTRVAPDGTVSLFDIELGGGAGDDAPAEADMVVSLLHLVIEHMLEGARGDELLDRLRETPSVNDITEIEDPIIDMQNSLLRGALQPLFVETASVCPAVGATL